MHVLLLTADPSLVSTFTTVSAELGIKAESSGDSREISEHLNRAKYEGLVLDFDTVADARPVLISLRESRSNKDAVVFAVATSNEHLEEALRGRADFLLRRPIDKGTVKQTLNAAYDLMLGERRRDLRCTAELRVKLKIINSGKLVECSTINVSSNGLAVKGQFSLKPAETVDVSLLLPDASEFRATGIMIWDDRHGKSGLHFQCTGVEMRHKLDSGLDGQLSKLRNSAMPDRY